MTSDEIVIAGVPYIATKRAAAVAGVSTDYLTRWCRNGWVQARRLAGGVWFVNSKSLEQYLAERTARSSERTHISRFVASRKIEVAGVTYIRSRDAARIVHLAPDYVSRLARGELIDGKLVDGLWFVNLISLMDFVADQERQKEAWRAQLAQMRREEQRLAGHPSALSA